MKMSYNVYISTSPSLLFPFSPNTTTHNTTRNHCSVEHALALSRSLGYNKGKQPPKLAGLRVASCVADPLLQGLGGKWFGDSSCSRPATETPGQCKFMGLPELCEQLLTVLEADDDVESVMSRSQINTI